MTSPPTPPEGPTADPWVFDAAWVKAVQETPQIIADCTCALPGPAHVSVTGIDGSVIAAIVCVVCGGILGTGAAGVEGKP